MQLYFIRCGPKRFAGDAIKHIKEFINYKYGFVKKKNKEVVLFSIYSIGQNIVGKFTNLSEIGLYMKCFTADVLQFCSKNVKVYLIGGWLGTLQQF